MTIDETMEYAATKGLKVKIIDIDGIAYEGEASHYSKADDGDDGYSTVSVSTKDKGDWCLGENGIKAIEILD